MNELHKIIKIISLIVVLSTAFFIGFTLFIITQNNSLNLITNLTCLLRQASFTTNKNLQTESNLQQNNLPIAKSKSLKFLFFGDIMLDRHVKEKIDKNGLDYIVANLAQKNFFTGYDLISANLEGAVTTEGAHYPPIQSYDFAFSPEIIGQLKYYNFNFLNLANNHLADQGARGIIETRENLKKLGLNYNGCIDGQVGACSSVVLNIADKKIGMAGFSMVYSKLDNQQTSKIIASLASSTDLVIINLHWGIEYEHQFNKTQQQTAHYLIDNGADIIIGHHPHVIQGAEIYESRPIFYSLGNFIFDQYFSSDTEEGLAVRIIIMDDQQKIFLYPFKSKQSQVELMDIKEKNLFLNKLAEWSEVSEEYKKQLIAGELIINITN